MDFMGFKWGLHPANLHSGDQMWRMESLHVSLESFISMFVDRRLKSKQTDFHDRIIYRRLCFTNPEI